MQSSQRLFTTSTSCQSEDEFSDEEEQNDADDDPSYVPDPDEEIVENATFEDIDDCLYE